MTVRMAKRALTGGCLCEAIRFELSALPYTAGYCHCTRCQRRTGTAASPQARVDGNALHLLQGGDFLRAWRHPDGGFEKQFCTRCGAHLLSSNPSDRSQVSVRMGAFDDDPGIQLTWRAFVSYAAPWEPIPEDGLERFAEGKPYE